MLSYTSQSENSSNVKFTLFEVDFKPEVCVGPRGVWCGARRDSVRWYLLQPVALSRLLSLIQYDGAEAQAAQGVITGRPNVMEVRPSAHKHAQQVASTLFWPTGSSQPPVCPHARV